MTSKRNKVSAFAEPLMEAFSEQYDSDEDDEQLDEEALVTVGY